MGIQNAKTKQPSKNEDSPESPSYQKFEPLQLDMRHAKQGETCIRRVHFHHTILGSNKQSTLLFQPQNIRIIDGDISSKLALVHIQICVIIAQQNKAKEPIAVVKKAPSAKYFNVTSYFKALLVTDLVGAFALHL